MLTSRVSVEMVQKSAAIGAPMIVAVSAPTALAVRMADGAGMTLVAIARKDGFEVFTHPQRVEGCSRAMSPDLSARLQAELGEGDEIDQFPIPHFRHLLGNLN